VASLFNGHARPVVPAFERGYYDERLVTGPAIRELEAPRRNWVIPAILVALALLAIPLLRGLRRPPATAPVPPPVTQPLAQPSATPPIETTPAPAPEATAPEATAPEATAPEATAPAPEDRAPETKAVEPGSISDMSAFLAEPGEATPQAFAPTPLNFGFASAKPTPESMKTIDEIASLLKAYPSATIRVESHTDNVGSPEANLDLSQARAEAIKSELIDRGVAGSRIETAGMGQELPIAGNDTAEGRAQNRRSDIVVTAR
jgi:outer membrane protein OmpA-like peptidoglycan-associated protein